MKREEITCGGQEIHSKNSKEIRDNKWKKKNKFVC